MAKKINKSDIAENDIFGDIRKSAEDTLSTLDAFNEELKQTADIVNNDLKNAFTGSAKGLNEFINASKKATKLQQDAEKVDQQRLQTIKLIQQIEIQAERQKQQKIATESKEIQLKQQKIREQEKEAKAAERLAKAARDEESEYKKLVKATRDLRTNRKNSPPK